MTRAEARNRMLAGETMDSIFRFCPGQECMIFKAEEFIVGGEIIYIPDIDLNEIPVDDDLSGDAERICEVLADCYTGDDFVAMCADRFGTPWDRIKAKELFDYVNWQHPSSALDAGEIDEDKED